MDDAFLMGMIRGKRGYALVMGLMLVVFVGMVVFGVVISNHPLQID